MPAHEPYFTKAQLEARISAKTVREILDDNNDGNVDTDAVDQIRKDATSKVDGYLAALGILPLDPNNIPYEVTRLTLDVAVALAAQRHPEVMRKDWVALMKQAETDLKMLRENKTLLGPPPDPQPANQGARVGETITSRTRDTPGSHFEDMGDF